MRWLWLRWHSRHGQPIVRYTNTAPITVHVSADATVSGGRLGGVPGRVVDGVLELGMIPLVPELACPCGRTRLERGRRG